MNREQFSGSALRFHDELLAAGLFDTDSDYKGMLGEAVMELAETFQKQGHSGTSAHVVAELFHKLVRNELLTPLLGGQEEWMEVGLVYGGKEAIYQNKRQGAVFATGPKGEKAYWLDGVHLDDGHGCVSGFFSRVPVKFPWAQPKTLVRPYWMRRFYVWRVQIWQLFGVM